MSELKDKTVMWLKDQWRTSLAYSIWQDLTPLGRATIWIPLWIMCWVTMPFMLVGGAFGFILCFLYDSIGKRAPAIFFK